jgi:hypothetical protein
VPADVRAYHKLVRPVGVLFGDDFCAWEGVRKAVLTFAEESKSKLYLLDEEFWAFRVPPPLALK